MRPPYRGLRGHPTLRCPRNESGRLAPLDPVVLGRKFCAGCGRWRHVCDYGWLRSRGQYRARCRVCSNRDARDRYVVRTPKQRERQREYWRFWQEARRRQLGVHERAPNGSWRARSAVDEREGIYLPVAPLRPLLDRWEASFEDLHHMAGGVANGMTPAPMMALAELSGVTDRTIHRIRHENKKVRIDIADKLAVALGVPSALIWEDCW